MTVLRALVEHFVAPVAEAEPRRPPAAASLPAHRAQPPAVGLLCGRRHARAAGCTVALHLAQRHRARAAVVALWTAGDAAAPGGGTPPTREARRVVRALDAREVPAHAAGRVVVAPLPAAQEDAASAAAQVFAVAAALPTVLVLSGPREDPLEDLLASRDLVLVAQEGDGVVCELAVGALRRRGVAARPCALPPPPVAAVAARGAAVLPAARRGLDLALEGLT